MERDSKSKTFLQFHQKKINLLLLSASMHMKQNTNYKKIEESIVGGGSCGNKKREQILINIQLKEKKFKKLKISETKFWQTFFCTNLSIS